MFSILEYMTVARLIDYFVPSHYDLSLTLEGAERRFSGAVTVTGELVEGADHIGLHAKDLSISSVLVDDTPATFSLGSDDELIITTTAQSGEHTITVAFDGTITDAMHGLYPCYYTHDDIKKELFATQFESHHAREVFPCVDEPAAKATFGLTLSTAPKQQVLSNMPIETQAEQDGQLVTTFTTTPRMSTYLLAFVVGELHKKSATTANGVEVNIWATPAQPAKSLDFALDTAVRAVEFYNEYFGTPYPLPKSDHIALPDFTVGGMENWGLITYREATLLVDPKLTSTIAKRHVGVVIAHELAHQWFGNLVTMTWWNDLWLNESFANLMEYIAIDAIYPDWNIWLEYLNDEVAIALRRDSIDGVQSVQIDIDHPDEIGTLFDGAIVYAKGGRLLRMIRQYIGDDAFRAGLKDYFAKHAYGNTVGNDLWNALERASGKQVKNIMNTWISQPGYPVVGLSRHNDQLSLTQQQFFVGNHKPSKRTWPVPLGANTSTLPALMTDANISVSCSDPVQLNQGDTAHFITHYDDLSYQALLAKISNGTLDAISRMQFLSEAVLLARGGIVGNASLLPLLQTYAHETIEPVWAVMRATTLELEQFVEGNEQGKQNLRHFAKTLAASEYERLGWVAAPNESDEDKNLRRIVIALSLYGENPDAITAAKKLYDKTPLDQLNPELRSLIIESVVQHGDVQTVDTIMASYKATDSVDLRADIAIGVTATRSPKKIIELLDGIKNPEIVRPQDVRRWFTQLLKHTDSRIPTWQWVQNNWDWIEATFAGDMTYDDFPKYSAAVLSTREQLAEYKAFFEPLMSQLALTRVIAMGISEIEGRVELIERDRDAVQQALLSYTQQ